MGIYARRPGHFVPQLLGDLCVLLWTIGWGLLARTAQRAVFAVAAPARQTAAAAARISGDFRQAAEQASTVPGLGGQLRRPFDAASGSLADVVDAAEHQVTIIERLAAWTGWLVFLVPVTVVLLWWLPRRIRFMVRARADQRFLDSNADLSLFALRAMTSQPLHVLAKISGDPVTAWRSGDARVINRLAEVELLRSGLRLPPPGAPVPVGKG